MFIYQIIIIRESSNPIYSLPNGSMHRPEHNGINNQTLLSALKLFNIQLHSSFYRFTTSIIKSQNF